jgi:hypothetical protein
MLSNKIMSALVIAILGLSASFVALDFMDTSAEEATQDMGQFWSYTLQFVYTGEHGTNIYWDFGDGETSEEMNPRHVYAEKGVYIVTQTATNTDGDGLVRSSTATYKVEVLGNPYITFVTPEGTPELADIEIQYKTVPNEPDNPVWEGHEFMGYFTDDTYLTEYNWSAPITAPVTLYVAWDDVPVVEPVNPDEITPEVILSIFFIVGLIITGIGAYARRPIMILVGLLIMSASAYIFVGGGRL